MSSEDTFSVAGRTFSSRLLVGTGKYKDLAETRDAIEASGAEIITIAVRRTNIGQNADEPNILDVLPPDRYTILPNTAGCYDAKTAVRTCRLAREILDGHNLVKLEVLGDEKTLFPDVTATLAAAEELIKDGFDMLYQEGATAPKMMSVGLHMRIIGHPARAAGLARLLDYIAGFDDVWVCKRVEIADHWITNHPNT